MYIRSTAVDVDWFTVQQPDWSRIAQTLKQLMGRYLEHLAAAGGPPYHISMIGHAMTVKNEPNGLD